MQKIIVRFEWDEKDLGEGWFNIFGLELCLFSKEYTKKELLKVTQLPNEPKEIETMTRVSGTPIPEEEKYPCAECGRMRTKAEGGTTFTVCDECWNKNYYCNCKICKPYRNKSNGILRCSCCHKLVREKSL